MKLIVRLKIRIVFDLCIQAVNLADMPSACL